MMKTNSYSPIVAKLLTGCLLFAALMTLGPIVSKSIACETPVYRFAMYQWQTDKPPYYVFYFHSGKISDADQKINQSINAFASVKPQTINVRYLSLDVSDKDAIKTLPRELQEKAQQLASKIDKAKLPHHLIVTPRGEELYSGKLTKKDVETLTQSPIRTKIAKSLGNATAGVFVLLLSQDKKANQQAEAELNKLIKAAAAGKIKPQAAGAAQPKEDEPAEIALQLIKISRDDPKEQWLIRCLLSVEDLEDEYLEKPLAYTIFGRGRVREPYIGKGIKYDNLIEEVHYLISPCSCEIKEQNKGMDIISNWDWDKTALSLAEKFGSETGNEELVPDDGIPLIEILPEESIKSTVVTLPKTDTTNINDGNTTNNQGNQQEDPDTKNVKQPDDTPEKPLKNLSQDDPTVKPVTASKTLTESNKPAAQPISESEEETISAISPMVTQVMWGVGIAAVILVAVTFVFLRPK